MEDGRNWTGLLKRWRASSPTSGSVMPKHSCYILDCENDDLQGQG